MIILNIDNTSKVNGMYVMLKEKLNNFLLIVYKNFKQLNQMKNLIKNDIIFNYTIIICILYL